MIAFFALSLLEFSKATKFFENYQPLFFLIVKNILIDVSPPVSSARILDCNQTDPIVTIVFDHLEPADRTKPVEEFWLRYSVDQEVDQGKWSIYPVPVKAIQHEVIGDSLRQVHGKLSIMLKPFGTVIG